MTLHNATPVRFSPSSLSDSLDATDEFPGACSVLQNLIPDPSTKNIWTCRPACTELTSFNGFISPGLISVFKVVGGFAFGLVASGRTAGFDEPFCFNLATGLFVPVANVTALNVPASPAPTGTPPTMELVGVTLCVTHPGFSGTNFFGWFDTFDPTSPRWHAGNLRQSGSITVLGAITGGAGYIPGTYLGVALTGGTGTGATADIVVALNGAVGALQLDTAGKSYTVGDSLSANNADLGGAGVGFAIPVSAIQTTGAIQFTTPPSWVRQFNGRGYFGVNPPTGQPSVIFTDSLSLGCTNANQALTFGDNLPLTAAAPLGLSNQLGGIIQALLVFKDSANIEQITGDPTTTNLSVNSLPIAIGTASPRSIALTPIGVAFLAPDGIRVIDRDAQVSEPLGAEGQGVVVPFINAVSQVQVNAACNGQIFRASVQNSAVAGSPWQEYWYDIVRKAWSGPHTFPSSLVDVFESNFILAPQSVPASLWQSTVVPVAASSYTENGVALTWIFQSAMLADNQQMAMSEIAETQVKTTAVQNTPSMIVSVLDQDGNIISQATYSFGSNSAVWDQSKWDQVLWGPINIGLYPRKIDFNAPTIVDRIAIQATGASSFGFKIGDVYMRTRPLGYIQAVA